MAHQKTDEPTEIHLPFRCFRVVKKLLKAGVLIQAWGKELSKSHTTTHWNWYPQIVIHKPKNRKSDGKLIVPLTLMPVPTEKVCKFASSLEVVEKVFCNYRGHHSSHTFVLEDEFSSPYFELCLLEMQPTTKGLDDDATS